MTRRPLLCAVAALALCACATRPAREALAVAPEPRLDAAQQRGHDFAVRRCSGCHNVGRDDGGTSEGPAFARLARRYNTIGLERRFAQVSAHGADRMPPIEFTHAELQDLVDYFNTL